MSKEPESPFVAGARVAVRSGYGNHREYREAIIDKVYKSGRFTLVGSAQQYRPTLHSGWNENAATWMAKATGESSRLSVDTIIPWNDTTDAEIRAAVAATNLRHRWRAVQHAVERMHPENVTEDVVAKIEAAIGLKEAPHAR